MNDFDYLLENYDDFSIRSKSKYPFVKVEGKSLELNLINSNDLFDFIEKKIINRNIIRNNLYSFSLSYKDQQIRLFIFYSKFEKNISIRKLCNVNNKNEIKNLDDYLNSYH